MNHIVSSSLMREYEKKRSKAQAECEKRALELMEKHPSLKAIENQIRDIGMSVSKKILSIGSDGSHQLSINLANQMDDLKEKRGRLLQSLNISPSIFLPKYECTLCDDTGFTKSSGEICSCYKQVLLRTAYRQVNLELLDRENFSNFEAEYYANKPNPELFSSSLSPRENILKIKERCLSFIESFESPEDKNLLFTGETGTGKTFMSNCIAHELLNRGRTVIYQTEPVLMDIIMNYKMRFEKPQNFNEEMYTALLETDLLIIDDLGTESLNSSRFSELFNILNSRLLLQESRGTKTILSTNLSLEQLWKRYDDRIISRIMGNFDIIRFFGDDIRLQKKR